MRVEERIQPQWRECVEQAKSLEIFQGVLTRKLVSFKLQGNAMYIGRFVLIVMRMLRFICSMSLRDKVSRIELRERIGIELVPEVVEGIS